MTAPEVAPSTHTLIRRMGLADLEFVVEEHLSHFPDNVFGQLGRRFLTEYYRTFLDGPHADAVVALVAGTRVGYLVGILDIREHRRLVRRFHSRRLAWYAARALARRPRMAGGLMRRRIAVRLSALQRRVRTANVATERIAVLSHVAVRPDARGLGLGTCMILQFVQRANDAGVATISVATRAGETGAGGLYEQLGWNLTNQRDTFDGRRIALYDLDLTSNR